MLTVMAQLRYSMVLGKWWIQKHLGDVFQDSALGKQQLCNSDWGPPSLLMAGKEMRFPTREALLLQLSVMTG